MALPNAYATYKNNQVLTATPGELTLMLYEGAIKFCNIALLGIEQNNIEKANDNIKKCRAIVTELRATLNFDYPVAQDFENVYVYITQRLSDANMQKDKAILEEVLEHLRTMKETWKEVIRLSK
ncbi:flagellar protein FliS [Lachnotalea glycerini]|jgi:flagellar secretion chaperone FliS|uniref:Flagellar export chaperone FliS n=1 Tax=Lachnotalea glycerini TaxID=1763509 RepID=A0A255IGH5_9FIRM|nr:flagellar export chaperone FliS [Lachnotalea glycerini]PXV90218.1 flagellar protein FliS [Lachnotalea glycerini]RDY30615.1 flagellar export chaperone FliS [Lachnotalea glycerini]